VEPDVTTPSPFRLQRAIPADAPAVRQLVREAYAKWVPVLGREPMPMRADYDLAVREHEVDLAYVGAELAGLIEVIVHADHLFIENVAVSPGHQGLGLGRYLMGHAEGRAKVLGLSRLCLLTAHVMEPNIRLYSSIGYQVDRTEPFMGGFTVYMSKDLVG
jgi:ribosomal protein S18 acetylase RimI-like enzyme